MKKKLGCLALVLGVSVLMGSCYLVWFSPDSGYYQTKLGLVRGAPFRMHGRVVDQYGNGVPWFEVKVIPLFSADTRRWDKGPVNSFRSITNDQGEFSIDTGMILVPGVALSGTERVTYDGQYVDISSGEWNFFTLDSKGRWMRDVRRTSPTPVVYDDTQPTILHVGISGPPRRMISFNRELTWEGDIPDELWLSLNVLTGDLKESRLEECDIQLHLAELNRYCIWEGDPETLGPRYEFLVSNGEGIQIKRDPFGCEAPPNGYEERAVTQPFQKNGQWQVDWKKETQVLYPTEPEVYFTSRDGHVFGLVKLHIECGGKRGPDNKLFIRLTCVANPRGERSLNGGGIPLPVTLPFKEDIPVVDQRKIWAYADPNKKNTLIVEGEKGAVEAGAGFTVLNRGLRGTEYTHITGDGSFRVSLQGKEGDPLEIHIGWPGGISPKSGKKVAQNEGVVLAPRWKLRGNEKP